MKKKQNKISINASDRLFDIIIYAFTLIWTLLCAYPLYFVFIASFSNANDVFLGHVVLWPTKISLSSYEKMFQTNDVLIGYRNSIFYMVFGTFLSLAATLPAAFALSSKRLLGNKLIMLFFVITMFVNGGLVPTYLLVDNLGLNNSIWIMLLLGSVNIYYLLITLTFFKTSIPIELYEASLIDGCSSFKYFFLIVLPLSKAIISVMAMFYGAARWNSYFNAMIFLRDKAKYPLQYVLYIIMQQNDAGSEWMPGMEDLLNTQNMRYGVIVVSILPMLLLYPFIQKYLTKGVMLGAIKG